MNAVRGATKSEDKMIRAIQRAVGLKSPDGAIGTATMSGIAARVGADCWPLTLKVWGAPCIVAEDVEVFNPKAPCERFRNSMSGSFSWQGKPVSILVSDGQVVQGAACHAWMGKPETVLYRLESGAFGVKRCKDASELPRGVRWAVGGVGLKQFYDPAREGFCRQTYQGKVYDYSDVMRRTDHTVLGVKDGLVWMVYARNMTGAQVNAFIRDKLCLELAVMLDGGHVAAINGEESFAHINTGMKQYYMIQAI